MTANLSASSSESAEVLRALFPFFIECDANGRIDAVGNRWGAIAPSVAVGAQILDVIEIERPVGIDNVSDLGARPNDIFVVALRTRSEFKLRGQFVTHRAGDGVKRALFVGSPWLNRIGDLATLGLTLADFPPHDSRGDFLILLQSQESTLADMQLLTQRLRATADALESRNRDMEHELELRSQLESQLRQSQKMEAVGRLAGGIAHDFNNILMAIHGYAALALSRLGAGDPVRGWVEEIRRASDRAASLTRQLLAFSRQQVLRPASLDLIKEVREVEGLLRPLIGERITVTVTADRELGRVWADPTAIQQIVMNLALNARDAMPSGGTLEIHLRNEVADARSTKVDATNVGVDTSTPSAQVDRDGYVVLSVRDSGIGMDEATKARIFEPFFTTKDVGKGSGLGLATVYGLVEQCGGRVDVESAPGAGSTFRVRLPRLHAQSAATVATPSIAAVGGRGERVLLVEDEPLVRRLLEQLLTRAGYHTVAAADAAEALLRVEREHAFDLIISDVVMAAMSGPEMVARIESQRGSIPTIFMSGHTEDVALRAGTLARHHRFIPKPFAPTELLALARELVATRES